MDRNELQSRQTPLKDRYRVDPSEAMITLHAEGRLGDEDVTCSVETGRAIVEAGLHPATGGSASFACSGDMLLQALVACAGVTLRAVATNMNVELRSGTVRADGDLDFRGTLGVDRDAPVGFQRIRLSFSVDTDADADTVAKLLNVTERACVVYQTLANPPTLAASIT